MHQLSCADKDWQIRNVPFIGADPAGPADPVTRCRFCMKMQHDKEVREMNKEIDLADFGQFTHCYSYLKHVEVFLC